jgi:hypothetical protein
LAIGNDVKIATFNKLRIRRIIDRYEKEVSAVHLLTYCVIKSGIIYCPVFVVIRYEMHECAVTMVNRAVPDQPPPFQGGV